MGGSKKESSGSSQTTQTTSRAPTAEETAFNKLQLEQAQEFDPIQRELNRVFGGLGLTLGRGENLPGNLAPLGEGLDPTLVNQLVQESLGDIRPGFQAQGLTDSGVRQEIEGRVAGDIRRNVAESDLNRKLNLLNLAIGAPAQITAPNLSTSSQLSQRLAGLRTTTTSGSSSFQNVQRTSSNPFGSALLGGLGKAATPFGAGFLRGAFF